MMLKSRILIALKFCLNMIAKLPKADFNQSQLWRHVVDSNF